MNKKYLSHCPLKVKKSGLLPEVDPSENIVSLAKALLKAGVRAIELTAGDETIASVQELTDKEPAIAVGVEGVDNVEDAKALIQAGAAWIGTPGVFADVVKFCAEKNVDCIPTVLSENEISAARNLGLHVVRCSANGKTPKDFAALHKALPDVNYILIDVARAEMHQYLDIPCVIALENRYISRSMVILEDWAGIEAYMTKEMLYMLDFHLGHIGYNTGSPENGKKIADRLEELFGFAQHPGAVNIFADEKFELLVIPNGPGVHGHVQMLCSSVERGKAFLERVGVEFAPTAKYQPIDTLSVVLETTREWVLPPECWDMEFAAVSPDRYVFLHYMSEQIGDFAFHLGRKFYAWPQAAGLPRG